MQYRCNDCGLVFEAEDAQIYREPDVGFEEVRCPGYACHSSDLTEVADCKLCGELEALHHLTVDGYCRACVTRTRQKFNAFLEKHFEKEELRILKDQWTIEPIE